jgi:hypothetical protein
MTVIKSQFLTNLILFNSNFVRPPEPVIAEDSGAARNFLVENNQIGGGLYSRKNPPR